MFIMSDVRKRVVHIGYWYDEMLGALIDGIPSFTLCTHTEFGFGGCVCVLCWRFVVAFVALTCRSTLALSVRFRLLLKID